MGAVEFGQLIKNARLRRGWQQQELADRIGVDRGYISTIENGKRNWPQSYIKPLASALGLDYVEMAIAAGIIPPPDRPAVERADPADPVKDELREKLSALQLNDERADILERVLDVWLENDRKRSHLLDQDPLEDMVELSY